MKKLSILFVLAICIQSTFGQNTLHTIIKDSHTDERLIGATAIVEQIGKGASSDTNGMIEIKDIPNGVQIIAYNFIGYKTRKDTLIFPLPSSVPLEIHLELKGELLEEIFVSTTRSSRTINNTPTRMETIAGEEIEEKGNMKPGDIRMMLNESTGIQTQQTSATSYNSAIRIQGLDGKYTQILRDGLPLYAGFSGGLSLLQIVPLDLKQVEVIKGASSTLYGAGAIAGLVNLISKVPTEKRELSFVLNGTSALGLDASGFYSQKFKKIGLTLFTSYNLGNPYDPSNIGLSAIPKFNRYTINPKLFFYFNEKTTMNIGFNCTIEDRIGGDMKYLENKGDSIHSYYEKNKTKRFSTQFELNKIIDDESKLSFKNSLNYYDRSIEIPNYLFSGLQLSSFSELSYIHKSRDAEWIGGLNLSTDQFSQNKVDSSKVVDYSYSTIGMFIQNTWELSKSITLETGLRGDYQNKYGFFLLPRFSVLLKLTPKLSSRIGGGLGYKEPSVFTEDAERIQFHHVLPINAATAKAEQSIGGNMDVNYKGQFSDEWFFSVNMLFFYTRVNQPLILFSTLNKMYEFQQPNGFVDTKGAEMNVKLTYKDFKLFVGYTFADVENHYNGNSTAYPLVAKHRLNNVLMYEIEDHLKMGLEAYYFSPQNLNDGLMGKQYWLTGFMIEKLWPRFSIFMNFENFGNTKQTKFDAIYTGTITNPVFRDIYAPLDGFVVNGGIKIKL